MILKIPDIVFNRIGGLLTSTSTTFIFIAPMYSTKKY